MRTLLLLLACALMAAVACAAEQSRELALSASVRRKFRKMNPGCVYEINRCQRNKNCRSCVRLAKIQQPPNVVPDCNVLRTWWEGLTFPQQCIFVIEGTPLSDLMYCLWDMTAQDNDIDCVNKQYGDNYQRGGPGVRA